MEKIEHTTVPTNGINMHIASIGTGPVVLFLHGFPELWYSWRHQLLYLSSHGYRCIAPDLRGYGDSDAPPSAASYTAFHIVGDLVGLLDHLGIGQIFLVGHDWGAKMAWDFCWFRPDRVRALVNMSVPFFPRNPAMSMVDGFRVMFGDDYYFCRFQEPGEVEKDFACVDTAILMKKFFSLFGPHPLCVSKEVGLRGLPTPDTLPAWLSEEDISYYASKFNRGGFTGGLNYYRASSLWELTAPWTGCQIKVPAKFVVGDQDIVYNIPGIKEYINSGGFKKDVPNLQDAVVMEGVGHFINQEKAEESSAHIYEFIKQF
ncbi:Bifunctional epoxide hydrolase 2 [Morella rubra]|uniref:soluble epoxide hydrolase n=1 Tax=Morella rubra TaxID=262757 RepID=A0A6A1WH20_9ROSI|nr:Bifunctional epoxide hydrolase 2 [Morella rubra]